MVSDIERIATIIGSKPVLGHWPHMQAHKDIEILRALEARCRELEAALKQSMTCIDDWLNIYASEMCDEKRVVEALERVGERGTLAYIAGVQEINRRALKPTASETICEHDWHANPVGDRYCPKCEASEYPRETGDGK